MKRKLVRVARVVIIAYVLATLLLFFAQRKLLYLPSRASEAALTEQGRRSRCEPWRDASGTIIGWKRSRRDGVQAANRLVVFHGNAGSALDRTLFIDLFEARDRGQTWEVHLFEYPGYGARAGDPNEASFTQAGRAAIAQLATAQDTRPIFLLGESLGSGLACALARDEAPRIAGLILHTPFGSMPEVAAHHYRFLPVRWLVRDRWDNFAALRDWRGPLAIVIASEDEVVTPAQGHALYDSSPGSKHRWVKDGTRHNTILDAMTTRDWQEISDFILAR